jgi:ABC-type dipeptide/oligopeptide/nickel transport system permease subunit
MMKTVIGLLKQEQNIRSSIRNLNKAGFTRDKIEVITHDSVVQKFIYDHQGRLVARYAGLGAFLGLTILGSFSLGLGVYACHVCGYPATFWIGNTLGFMLIGAILGLLAGWFSGTDKLEKIAVFYSQGVRLGSKLVAVTVNDELLTKAMDLLRQENAVELKML